MKIRIVFCLLLPALLMSCSPTSQIRGGIQEILAMTQTANPILIPTNSTISPITLTISPTPHPTETPSPLPTETSTPEPTTKNTVSGSPSLTPSPTLTPTPTLTPVLLPLSKLTISNQELNDIQNQWLIPPENLTLSIFELDPKLCSLDCVGKRWDSIDGKTNLTLLIYRVSTAEEALYSMIGARSAYITHQDFIESPLAFNISLSIGTWVASRDAKDFILYSFQGPAIFSLYWQSNTEQDPNAVLDNLGRFAQFQTDSLRNNGYVAPLVNPTIFPNP